MSSRREILTVLGSGLVLGTSGCLGDSGDSCPEDPEAPDAEFVIDGEALVMDQGDVIEEPGTLYVVIDGTLDEWDDYPITIGDRYNFNSHPQVARDVEISGGPMQVDWEYCDELETIWDSRDSDE